MADAELRGAFLACTVGMLVVRVYFQAKVRRAGAALKERRDLPALVAVIKGLTGLAGVLSIAYLVAPELVAWAALPLPEGWRWLGLPLGALGLALFAWTHAALGRNWSLEVGLKEGHELVTRGPYRWVRHPMYTAILAWALGVLLLSANALAGAPWLAMSLLASSRAPREEALMREQFGPAYDAYVASSGRFLPRPR